ncbi:O-antigen ligase family protein [Paenibacillus sp. YPG26]|uniref:O-antigen ligase family protein n=1 Tax=Paenibacillus sp. YPG26 TaxID=2878915 RepID=UPI00203B0BB3|nr:O-antigen ligase family protein [Paenibacillus sp. YPG26]USB33026.1 O-antigen ligase family protein [Paenibacillus sp. YPG26]
MNVQLILILLLVLVILIFGIQCILQLGLRLDAGYVLGFSIFFDAVGYFYKQYIPVNSFILLVGAPLLFVIIALFEKPDILREMFSNEGLWLWGLFLSYCVLSYAWAPMNSSGLSKELLLIIRAVIPGLYTYILCKRYGKLSWTIVALFGLAYAATHLLFGQYSSEYPGRLTLPGDNPIFNARISLIAAAVAIWGRNIPWLLRLVTLGAALTSAFATQSRGPVASFVAANVLILAYILYKKYKNGELRNLKRYTAAIAGSVLLAAAAAGLYSEQLGQWIGSSRFTVLFSQSQLKGDDNFLGRMDLQIRALESFQEQPFFGSGLGGSTPPVQKEFPHNIIIEMASELGITGLFMWLAAYLFSLWSARAHPVLMVLLIQSLGCALLSGDFGFNYEYMLIAWVSLAFLRTGHSGEAESSEKSSVSYYRI